MLEATTVAILCVGITISIMMNGLDWCITAICWMVVALGFMTAGAPYAPPEPRHEPAVQRLRCPVKIHHSSPSLVLLDLALDAIMLIQELPKKPAQHLRP